MTATQTPEEIARQVALTGASKARAMVASTMMLSVMAGAFIAFGGLFASTVAVESGLGAGPTRLIAGASFTLGLYLVVVTGAELFTGNNLMIVTLLGGQIKLLDVARNWIIVYLGNLVGALIVVLLVYYSQWWAQGDYSFAARSIETANDKVSLSFETALIRGVLANILVCLAVWMAAAGRTLTDKLLAVLLPITAFVAAGFEHSIANMYFTPVGLLISGDADAFNATGLSNSDIADLNLGGVINNLVAVTIGNMIGGVMVGIANWVVHLRRRVVNALHSDTNP